MASSDPGLEILARLNLPPVTGWRNASWGLAQVNREFCTGGAGPYISIHPEGLELTVTAQEIFLESGDPKRFRVWEQMVLRYQLREDGNGCWNVLRKEKRPRLKAGSKSLCPEHCSSPRNGWSGVGKGVGKGSVSGIRNLE